MKHSLLFLAFLAMISPVFSQNAFEKTFGQPGGTVQVFLKTLALPDGGYLFAGYREKPNSDELESWALRTDALHNTLWETTLGDTYVADIARGSDGSFFLLGKAFVNENLDKNDWLAKVDGMGAEIWKKNFTAINSFGGKTALAATADGGIAVVGQDDGGLTKIVKYKSDGAQVWSKSYSGDSYTESGIVAAADGSFRYFTVFNGQLMASKLDETGIVKWSKLYPDTTGGTSNPQNLALAMAETPIAGGFILLGSNTADGKTVVTKTDADGNITWQSKASNSSFGSPSETNIAEMPDGAFAALYGNTLETFTPEGSPLKLANAFLYKLAGSISFISSISDFAITGQGKIALAGSMTNSGDGTDAIRLEVDNDLVEATRETYGDKLPYAGELGTSVQLAPDGGYLVAGLKDFTGKTGDFHLMKTDKNGLVVWENNYGNENHNDAYSTIYTSDGGILTTGREFVFAGGQNLELLKTDASGTLLWTKKFNFSQLSTNPLALELPDGNFYIYFRGSLKPGMPSRAGLMKINPMGDSLFTKRFANGVSFRDVRLAPTGGAFAIGAAQNGFAYLLKTDLNGNILFEKTLGEGGGIPGTGYGIEPLASGDILASGNLGTGNTMDSMFLVRLDPVGGIVWEKFLNPTDDSYYRPRLNKMTDGNFVVSLSVLGDGPASGLQFQKIDQNGDPIWANTFKNYETPLLFDSKPTADGGLVATGSVFQFGSPDLYLVKVREDGSVGTSVKLQKLGDLQVSPNPSTGPLSVRFESAFLGKIEIAVFDEKGRMVHRFFEEKTTTVFEKNWGLAALPSGACFVRLTADGRSISRGWIKR